MSFPFLGAGKERATGYRGYRKVRKSREGDRFICWDHFRFWPILLKKSALVTTAEKLAFEIEILKSGRGLRAQI